MWMLTIPITITWVAMKLQFRWEMTNAFNLVNPSGPNTTLSSGAFGTITSAGAMPDAAHLQPVGADPKNFDPELSQTYGVGSSLLAGSEIHLAALMGELPRTEVRITNALDSLRPRETVELDWKVLKRKLPGATGSNLAVMDGLAGHWLVAQVLDKHSGGKPEKLLFRSDFLPPQRRALMVFSGVASAQLPSPAHVDMARNRSPLKVK